MACPVQRLDEALSLKTTPSTITLFPDNNSGTNGVPWHTFNSVCLTRKLERLVTWYLLASQSEQESPFQNQT
jgi:hypothetical protein